MTHEQMALTISHAMAQGLNPSAIAHRIEIEIGKGRDAEIKDLRDRAENLLGFLLMDDTQAVFGTMFCETHSILLRLALASRSPVDADDFRKHIETVEHSVSEGLKQPYVSLDSFIQGIK